MLCAASTQPITDPSLPVLSPQGEHQQGSFLRHAGHQEEEDSQQEMKTVHSMTTAASLAESLCVCVCVLQGSLRSPLVLSGLQDKQQTQMGDRCFFFHLKIVCDTILGLCEGFYFTQHRLYGDEGSLHQVG